MTERISGGRDNAGDSGGVGDSIEFRTPGPGGSVDMPAGRKRERQWQASASAKLCKHKAHLCLDMFGLWQAGQAAGARLKWTLRRLAGTSVSESFKEGESDRNVLTLRPRYARQYVGILSNVDPVSRSFILRT